MQRTKVAAASSLRRGDNGVDAKIMRVTYLKRQVAELQVQLVAATEEALRQRAKETTPRMEELNQALTRAWNELLSLGVKPQPQRKT